MPPDEEERQQKFLELLLALALVSEKRIARELREEFLRSMRSLRRLVQRMSPDGAFRAVEWNSLRREVPEIISPLISAMAVQIVPELKSLAEPVQVSAQDYAGLENTPIAEPDDIFLLTTTLIAGVPLLKMLGLNGNMTNSLTKYLDRIVDVGLLRGDSTAKIVNDVMALGTRNGKIVPRIATGSFASKASAQIKNTVASSVWSAVNNNLITAWKPVDNVQWVWNAVLDTRLCPVCRPLNGKIVPKPTSFVSTTYGVRQPPVHPNCRCAIVPLRT